MACLLDKLKEKGWYVTEPGLKKLEESTKQKENIAEIIRAALNADLKEICGGLPQYSKENINGNLVLQVMKVRNVSAPKSNEESKAAPRLLKIQLTDGQNVFSAVGKLYPNTNYVLEPT